MADGGTAKKAKGAPRRATTKKGGGKKTDRPVVSELAPRVEAFRELARRVAAGEPVMRPGQLHGLDRHLHVRDTIIEDHATRIASAAQGAREKFDKLAGSRFAFFRGTSLLFHRDMAGEDARMPTVLLLGDVHPGNFGIMPNADNVPIFGVNDFDDVAYGPFTWDLKRGAVGFMLAAEEMGGHKRKRSRKIARCFVAGYLGAMRRYAARGTEDDEELRADNSPKIIRALFEEARKPRAEWLSDRYLDETGRGFRANEELTPVSRRVPEFQEQIDRLAQGERVARSRRAEGLTVKDVAIRHGQGTASLGLPRYYVLLEGPSGDATDDLIVEFKKARRSALEGLAPSGPFDAGETGDRIAHGQSVHLAQGDVFYGAAELDGESFMTRERAPFREDMDLDDLSKKGWKAYARVCGRALALAHARSDEVGQIDYDVEPRILEAVGPEALFIDDILDFAVAACERLARDHEAFRRDHARGAFEDMNRSYR
ncbi:DUF2252 family protein (plasmid) [Limimaricola variabilis]|uniref:DUF2252 domain-containing protein n=1 Tax=Limimaricola variabilis TaxID=1492771 RepID=UPI002AC90C6C|nr:DUF2252 family protein [Limimaricola variabilis]WPY96732.1 DUF2252 family protein [Limimaricola variabilis]